MGMMTVGEVIQFDGLTENDTDPDVTLENNKGLYESFWLLGVKPDGSMAVVATHSNIAEGVFLMAKATRFLLQIEDEQDDEPELA
jgi:hypothetical protein